MLSSPIICVCLSHNDRVIMFDISLSLIKFNLHLFLSSTLQINIERTPYELNKCSWQINHKFCTLMLIEFEPIAILVNRSIWFQFQSYLRTLCGCIGTSAYQQVATIIFHLIKWLLLLIFFNGHFLGLRYLDQKSDN